jgi:hypothetical protein
MGSYYIPSNKLKGESRILYIFTGKSLIYTAVGALIGLIFYGIFSFVGLKVVGIILVLILSVLGYSIATVKFPNGNSKISKNVGGESLDEIIGKYIMYKKNISAQEMERILNKESGLKGISGKLLPFIHAICSSL